MKPFSQVKKETAKLLEEQDSKVEAIRLSVYSSQMEAFGVFLVFLFLWWTFYYLGKFPLKSLAIPLVLGPGLFYLHYKAAYFIPVPQQRIRKPGLINRILSFFRLAKRKPDKTLEYLPAVWKRYLAVLKLNNQFSEFDPMPLIKRAIVQRFVNSLSHDLKFVPEGFVPYDDFKASQLFVDMPGHYSGDDLIEGTVDGIPLKISELNVKLEIPGKKKNWQTLFNGIFIVATYSRPFKTNLLVLSNELEQKLGYAGRLASESNVLRMSFISSTHTVFNKHFSCYAQDPRLGEELLESLLPSLLRYFNKTKRKFSVSLQGDKIYAAIQYDKPVFVFDPKQPIWSHRNLKIAYQDFKDIYDFIETLDIDRLVLPTLPEPVVEEEYEEEEIALDPPKPPRWWHFWKWKMWSAMGLYFSNLWQSIQKSRQSQAPANRWEYLNKLQSRRNTDGDGKEGWSR